MKHLRLLFTSACLAFALHAEAQQPQPLYLQSGTVTPVPNLHEFVQSPVPTDRFGDWYYRVLQFETLPSEQQKEAMRQSGVLLLNYLPKNAFVAAIPVRYDRTLLAGFNVTAVHALTPHQKISKLIIGGFHDWAINAPGTVDLNIQYQSNLPLNMILTAARKHGEVLGTLAEAHTVQVRISDFGLMAIAAEPWVSYVNSIPAPGEKEDTKGRSLHRSNYINSDWANGRHYDGTGVTVTIADDGFVGPHIDFTGRMTNQATGAGATHGDMTSGICVGAGNLDPTIRGMATGAYLYTVNWSSAYDWITDAVQRHNDYGIVIASTSYSQGCNEYTTETQLGDNLLYDNQYLQFVFSAGNNGGGDCSYGAGAGWGNITGGYKQGKNVIACGNLDALEVLDNTSSRGPSSDGRVKPDICANGKDQLSTDENNTYQVGGGTSAASPGTAGVFAQLYQAWKETHSDTLAPAPLIKAAMLNSAEDIGNPGPDFTYGWGRVNAYRAVKVIEDNTWITGTVSNGSSNTHTINVPAGTTQLRAMIYWADPGGTPLAAPALVNNLNMQVTDPSSVAWNPWILDPTPNASNLNTPAVRGVDSLNNAEQVTIDNPAAGAYTVSINGYAVPSTSVNYYLVWEFRTNDVTWIYPNGGEGFVPGETEVLRWDGQRNLGTYTLEYTTNNGTTWNVINSTVPQTLQQLSWVVPNSVSGAVKFRISRNGYSDESDTTLAIINVPGGITVNWACADSMNISWNSVTGAAGYEVYALGAKYMDAVGTSTTTNLTFSGVNPYNDNWLSVAAITADGNKGRRAYAVNKSPGLVNCTYAIDAEVLSIASPGSTLLGCHDNTAVPVAVTIQNTGATPITSIDLHYQIDAGPVVTESFTSTIAQGSSQLFTFTIPADLSVIATYQLSVWATLAGDQNSFNDSISQSVEVLPGLSQVLPVIEDFETSGLCSDATNCEVTVCPLANGWVNATNGDADDIDFRVQDGSTPSTGTGPDVDHTSGTASGKYAYLEASACFAKRAELLSPCINLSGASSPHLTFWYHMYGADMGSLHIDILSQGTWTNDVMTPITGDHGNSWLQEDVDLTPWIGEIITVRFRGITGADYQSDIAIDDINVIENTAAPIIVFMADKLSVCQGEVVTLTDMSLNAPATWTWTITPNTFSFVNGTNANSQNPQVVFNAYGTYDVELSATNGFGANNLVKNGYISAVTPAAVPLAEDFDGGAFPPSYWRVEDSGQGTTWASSTVTGAGGTSTDVASFDNYTLNSIGAEDYLRTMEIDLTTAAGAMLTFDVAYAPYVDSTYFDQLRIDVSTDCGANWTNGVYLKGGVTLGTVPITNVQWAPSQAADWRRDSVLLTGFTGSNVQIRFTNINDFGNVLYIDNVNIDITTSLGDPASVGNVSVYPNPSAGAYNLELKNSKSERLSYEVTDPEGRLILSEIINAKYGYNGRIDLSKSAPGVYLLKINGDNGSKTIKLIRY